jgi:RNA polymerase-binding transcription factor DksA
MPNSKNAKAAAKPAPKQAAKPAAKSVTKPATKPAAGKTAPAAHAAPAKKEAKPAAHTGHNHTSVLTPPKVVEIKDPFLKRQKERLLQLRDGMLDSMTGVARDTLRSRAEGSEASAFGMHQADAGSDAYDRDFALSLLSQEQDALYEIDEALKRIEQGTYGICELCNKAILHARLEAIPFARFTVDCQSQLEKQRKMTRSRQPVTSLFGLTDEEGGSSDNEEEETVSENKE